MSWDASLIDDRGHVELDVNYTHNCNGMANVAAIEAGHRQMMRDRGLAHWRAAGRDDIADRNEADPDYYDSWWSVLDGMTGPEGAAFLHDIISGMEADPERFVAMNPRNGWGDFDSFLDLLRRMRDAVPEWPTAWHTNG